MDADDIEASWREQHKTLADGSQERHLRGVVHFPKLIRQHSLPAGVTPLGMIPPAWFGYSRGAVESSWDRGVLHVSVLDTLPPQLEIFPLPEE